MVVMMVKHDDDEDDDDDDDDYNDDDDDEKEDDDDDDDDDYDVDVHHQEPQNLKYQWQENATNTDHRPIQYTMMDQKNLKYQ